MQCTACAADSIFSGYQIDRRVYVSWGQYTVVGAAAARLLPASTFPAASARAYA
jgi:hypothetical protein